MNGADGTITIDDCMNYGEVSSNIGNYGRAGGIIGQFGGPCTVNRCINTGNVTGYQGAGGIVGWSGDSGGLVVNHSYNNAAIHASNGDAGGIEQGAYNQTSSYSLNAGEVSCAADKTAYRIGKGTITSCYYYDGATLKDNSGNEAGDIDATVATLNTGLQTAFWGKDGSTIKPLSLIDNQ